MGKYTVYDHKSGRVCVGDVVAAFVPSTEGREVKHATITGINRLSIRVKYWDNGWYETVLKDHQWCLVRTALEEFIDVDMLKYLQDSSEKLSKLEAAGVDNWDGYDDAVAGE
jgi:hypothetical protein